MPTIHPFLWFDDQAEAAMNFYVSVFEDSKIDQVMRYGEGGPGPAGSVMTASFQLGGQRFTALNGGPHFKFTEAVSFVVTCADQAEVDRFWDKLSEGGAPGQCGWLKDKFGLSWQIVPSEMPELLGGPDPDKAKRAMEAMMKMTKLDIAALKAAREG
ncbi:MAG: VOC family protein [Caulobacteraceae bacterium]|nr:VOC family protein [Caulobacteraceae bacterium]